MDGARWYNPATATFTTRDTYPGAVGANTTLNRYTYGLNNPLSYNDPTGHSSEPVCDNACLWAQYQNTGDIGTDHTYYENEDGSFNSGVHVTVGDNGEILVTAPTDVVLSTASQTSRSQSLSYTPNEATPQAVEMLISVNMSVDEIARGINGPLDGIRTDPLTSGANELVNTGSTYVSDLFVMLQNSTGRHKKAGPPTLDAYAMFEIPKWAGYGTTHINLFISSDKSCLESRVVIAASFCLKGDNRPVGSGDPSDPFPPSRVRFTLDHERGIAMMFMSHSENLNGESKRQRPVQVFNRSFMQFKDFPGGGDDNFVNNALFPDLDPASNLVIQYRGLDSFVPQGVGFVAPAVDGYFRVQPKESNRLEFDGQAEKYPSMEIIRDRPNGTSSRIYSYKEQGGPAVGLSSVRSFGPEVCGWTSC